MEAVGNVALGKQWKAKQAVLAQPTIAPLPSMAMPGGAP